MSAIGPHLGQYESDELELRYAGCAAAHSLRGVGLGKACPPPEVVVAKRHMELSRIAYTRQVLAQYYTGAKFHVQYGRLNGKSPRDAFLILDRVTGQGPVWNKFKHEHIREFPILTWTSKMFAPSFSLPSGSPGELGGTCPGAKAGQTVVSNESIKKYSKYVLRVVPQHKQRNLTQWLADSICDACYAGGGAFRYASKQAGQMILHEWTQQALRVPTSRGSNLFVDTMIEIIDHANYKPAAEHDRWRDPYPRFFRIHDSGDFFSKEYLAAWKRIAEAFSLKQSTRTPVLFWAPSRIWATPDGTSWVNAINAGTSRNNLIIRPSAFHINDGCPQFTQSGRSGWSAGSVVIHPDEVSGAREAGIFDWNCNAYAAKPADVADEAAQTTRAGVGANDDPNVDLALLSLSEEPPKKKKEKSCREAIASDDKAGCRHCWVEPTSVVNYTLH